MTRKLLVATRNPGKQREIAQILADAPCDLVFLSDTGITERPEEETLEHADSFEGNAQRKAEYFARRSGLATVADDSGIEVFALGGKPGVKSRRFAMLSGPMDVQDEANNRELLRRLAGLPEERRRARYRCVVAFVPRPSRSRAPASEGSWRHRRGPVASATTRCSTRTIWR